ncbi:MAG: hypothetical protein HOW97_40450 [Catenulispora sp.]|nr:hypothetical protein [Catenulispora sp.]
MLDQDTVQELADRAFGRWAMAVPSERWLSTAGIEHQPTVDFLRAVGVPVQARIYDDGTFLSGPATTFADFLAEAELDAQDAPDEKFVDAYGSFIDFGYSANCETVYLDPRTGHIYDFINYQDAPRLYYSSVSHLVYFAAYWEIHGKLDGVWLDDVDEEAEDLAFDAADAIGQHFTVVDPAANVRDDDEQDSLWESIASDGFAAGLYVDWEWSDSAVEYFHQRGINPLTKTPRHELENPAANPWAADDERSELG